MKYRYLASFLLLLALVACGDNSPFDEDYWVDPNVRTEEDSDETAISTKYEVTLTPIVAEAADLAGTSTITVTATDSITETRLTEVPQSLMIGQRSITNLTCEDVIATNPNPQIPNETGEFKEINLTDNGTREALVAELNQADPNNGDSVNLAGKRFVVRAYVGVLNTPGPQSTALIPIACGVINVAEEDDSDEDDNDDNSTGGTSGGETTGGTTGGSSGGTTGGTAGGTTGTTP